MEQTSIPTIIKLMREEQTRLKTVEKNAGAQHDVLQRFITELESSSLFTDAYLTEGEVIDPSAGSGTIDLGTIKEQFPDYPFSGERTDKIRYIIDKSDTVLRLPEIKDIITKLEGPTKSPQTINSMNHSINSMVHQGELLQGKVDDSKRQQFYGLKRFFHNVDLKPVLREEHAPKSNTWFGSLPKQKRNLIFKTKWIGGRKM